MSRISSEEAKREGEENVSGTMNSLLEGAGKTKKQVEADDEGGLETLLQVLRRGTDLQ